MIDRGRASSAARARCRRHRSTSGRSAPTRPPVRRRSLHDVDERGDIVVGDRLALVDRARRRSRRARESCAASSGTRRAAPTPRPRAPRPRATPRSAPRR
jgi:hypothetical protein